MDNVEIRVCVLRYHVETTGVIELRKHGGAGVAVDIADGYLGYFKF